MSSTRLKERGGGGGKTMAPQPHKVPHESGTPKHNKATTLLSGKENQKLLSGRKASVPRQRPSAAAATASDLVKKRVVLAHAGAARWSTSSMPGGKASSNPKSSFSKIMYDLHRSSIGREIEAVTGVRRVLERCQQQKKNKGVFDLDGKIKGGILKPCLSSEEEKAGEKVMDGISLVRKSSRGESRNHMVFDSEINVEDWEKDKHGDEQLEINSVVIETSTSSSRNHDDLDLKPIVTGNVTDGITVFECMNELKDVSNRNGRVVNRYQSKLHKKLALLEGRVQRIAKDIKRTKEILDMNNNVDASKLILADIQNKILGIEEAVANISNQANGELGLSESAEQENVQLENFEESHSEVSQCVKVGNSKVPVKDLNHEELEARFFPHHRLLRGRTTIGPVGGKDVSCKPIITKHDCDPIVEEGPPSPMEENPIAMEFLASLDVDQPTTSTRSKKSRSMCAVIQEMVPEGSVSGGANSVSMDFVLGQQNSDIAFMANEKMDEFDDQENKPAMLLMDESDDSVVDKLFGIGHKTSTGGWFVSEGEAVLLAHSDGSCSYYDVVNCEDKAEYLPPPGISNNLWGDCWLIRAPRSDGCAGKYVVAASAGSSLESGFCSWDFYKKDIKAFKLEQGTSTSGSASTSLSSSLSSRAVLAPLSNLGMRGRSSPLITPSPENQQWWYRPCGCLIASTSSRTSVVSAYDIRDGLPVMTWGVQSPVVAMEYSCPLQWRNTGKVVVAGTESINIWDVNSLNPHPLQSIASDGKKIYALHVNNTDAELGGGVRQRVSSSEEGNDGVFCTQDSINVFDFRLSSGVGLRIQQSGSSTAHSIFSRGDSILLGGTEPRSISNGGGFRSGIQQFSLRKGKLMADYDLPDVGVHSHHSSISQVWGNSNFVMGICGMGLCVWDTVREEELVGVRETIGPDDLYYPSFDYMGGRVLVISRDRPAMWRYLL